VSASTLRAAAALIRERAHVPTNPDEEPWFRYPLAIGEALPWAGFAGAFPAEAQFIASWPPAVALDVARLFDAAAKVGPVDGGILWDATVTLARTCLGNQS
jgi:hypothetical protein